MTNDRAIAGALIQYDRPDWEPLHDLVGIELADWFMWMHEIELADRTRAHAYKHVATRCYVYVAEDGRAFTYTRAGRYLEIGRGEAIHAVFDGWEELALWPGDPEEAQAVRAAIAQALRTADGKGGSGPGSGGRTPES